MLKVLKMLFLCLIEDSIRNLSGGLGRRLRYAYYKYRLKKIGKGVVIDVGVRIINPHLVTIGDNTWIDNYVIIIAGPPVERDRPILRKSNDAFQFGEGEVVIEENCHVAIFVVIQGHGGVYIGPNTGIASGAKIYSMSHHYSNPLDPTDPTIFKLSPMAPPREQSLIVAPVVMGRNTALGLNSVLLPGATLNENSWLGTNSMAFKVIPPNTISMGVPAEVVTRRVL